MGIFLLVLVTTLGISWERGYVQGITKGEKEGEKKKKGNKKKWGSMRALIDQIWISIHKKKRPVGF